MNNNEWLKDTIVSGNRNGMRLFKTGLAVMITLIVAEPLGMTYPFFAAIATIISMEATLANSYKAGKNRVKGTLLGAVLGLVFALMAKGNPFAAGVGIMVVLWICNRMGWKNAISIACIVFLAIMVNLDGDNPWVYSFNRLKDTLVGVGVALVVNYLVFPFNNETQIRRRHSEILGVLATYLERAENAGYARITYEGLRSLEAAIDDYHEQLVMYEQEVWLGRAHDLDMDSLKKANVFFKQMLNHLAVLFELEGAGAISLPDIWSYHHEKLIETYKQLLKVIV